MTTVVGTGTSPGDVGVIGESQQADGIHGIGHSGAGVSGVSDQWLGVYGESLVADGVRGQGRKGAGVSGLSDQWLGVYGESQATDGVRGQGRKGAGVSGLSDQWLGVYGESQASDGIRGQGRKGAGVSGLSDDWIGVFGESQNHEGVHAETHSTSAAALAAYQSNPAGTGAAVYGESRGTGPAAFFKGDVVVTGDVLLNNRDVAERFLVDAAQSCEPGAVMVAAGDGALTACTRAYDRGAVGVVSGAGTLRPAVTLGEELRDASGGSAVVALVGTVHCRVDADRGAISPGDLLTTSETPGHAMKADDDARSRGAVIGKALSSLAHGRGLVMMLVALQ